MFAMKRGFMRLRSLWNRYASLTVAFLAILPSTSVAQQIAIGAYSVARANSYPGGITVGPDGALWFSQVFSIGRITTAGTITEYDTPGGTTTGDVCTGPDGALWFTGTFDNNIGRITTAGVFTMFPPVPTPGSLPDGITAGPDGALWFTETYGNNIGRITTGGAVKEYPVPTANSSPGSITAGPDGAIWFTEGAGNIGRITTGGVFTEYIIPTAGSSPGGITTGPDGALWFTEGAGKIGRVNTGGVFTEYPLPTGAPGPVGITTGPDGALWFTQGNYYGPSDIGRITTAGVITEYRVPTTGALPSEYISVVTGPDGELWFTESYDNAIGEAVFVTANLTVSPATASYNTALTFTGSLFAPNENVRIYKKGVGSQVLASAAADSTGSFTVSGRAPESPNGLRIFLGVGQTSGKVGAASFSVTPRLIVTPSSGPVGRSVSISGYGFGANDQVQVNWHNPDMLIGFATTDPYGTFKGTAALTFTVPSGSPTGPDGVFGIGQTPHVVGTGRFTVQ